MKFFKACNKILQLFKLWLVILKIFHKNHGSFLERISFCAHALLRWVAYMFDAFINTDITATWFQRLFVMCIHSFLLFILTRGILLSLNIILTQIIFMLFCVTFAHTHYIDTWLFFHITWSYHILNCFVDMFCFLFNCFVDFFLFQQLMTELFG